MKKRISILLVMAMLLTVAAVFSGCSNLADQFIGTWRAEVDLADMVNQELEADETTAEYFTIDSFKVTMVMSFAEDGTFREYLEEASVQSSFEGMMEDLKEGVTKMLEDQIKATGVEMTVDQMLAVSGMTLDDMMEELMDGFAESGLVDQIVEEASMEGNFKVQEGKLFLSAGLEYAVDETVYETFTLEQNSLTLTGHVGGEDSEGLALYPVTFTKDA